MPLPRIFSFQGRISRVGFSALVSAGLFSSAMAYAQAPSFEYRVTAPALRATPAAASPAQLQLSTSSVNFGDLAAHTSATRQVLLTNTGGQALALQGPASVTGNAFFQPGSSSCADSLAAGAQCSVQVTFSPTSTGSFNATLTFTSALANSPHEVSLQGTAFNPLSLAGGSLVDATQNQPYSVSLLAKLGVSNEPGPDPAQVSWSAPLGLPGGLSLNEQTGTLSGTPSASGAFSFDVQALYKQNTARATYNLTVGPDADPYWNYVTAVLNFEGVPGAKTVTEPVKGLPLTFSGAAALSGNAKFGATALSVVGGYVDIPGAPFALGTRPFTFEAFIRRSTSSSGTFALLETRPLSTNGAYITISVISSGAVYYYVNEGIRVGADAGAIPADGAWYHVAYSRDQFSTGRLFINGQQVGSSWVDTTSYLAPATVGIGRNAFGSAQAGGFVDAVRLTDGQARYVGPFTPPAREYPLR